MLSWKLFILVVLIQVLTAIGQHASTCNGGYAGAQCQIFLPVYETAPGVVGISETTVMLSINTSPVNPQQTPPTAFVIEYRNVGLAGNAWVTHNTVDNYGVIVNPHVSGLQRGESYRFRFIPVLEVNEDRVIRGKESPASREVLLDKDCPVGDWGVECVLTCHCADEDSVCDPEEGKGCSMCSDGYAGKFCWVQLPTLSQPPTLTVVKAYQVALQITPWVAGRDAGQEPEAYRIQSKEKNKPGWISRLHLPASRVMAKFNTLKSWTIAGLTPCTNYLLRIVPVAENWEGTFPGLPSPHVSVDTLADEECFEKVDYLGGDLGGCSVTTDDAAGCQALCMTNPSCYFFTWLTPSFTGRERQCCLKHNTGWTRVLSITCISGPKYCPHTAACPNTASVEGPPPANGTVIIIAVCCLVALVAIVGIIGGVICYKRSHRAPEMSAQWQAAPTTQRALPSPPLGIAPPLSTQPPAYLDIASGNPYMEPQNYDNLAMNRQSSTYDDINITK